MFTAAINSATHQTSVAFIQNGKLLSEKSWTSNKDEAEKILPELFKLMKKAKKGWQDLDEIFIVNGPGPFTGLRVGVTLVNVLGWSTASSFKSADVFEYFAARLPLAIRKSSAILIKAGGDNVALMLPQAKNEQLVPLENLAAVLKKSKVKNLLADLKPQDLKSMQKLLKTYAGLKFINQKKLKTFGNTAVELIKTKKHSKRIKPLYLQKPLITKSKKNVFA